MVTVSVVTNNNMTNVFAPTTEQRSWKLCNVSKYLEKFQSFSLQSLRWESGEGCVQPILTVAQHRMFPQRRIWSSREAKTCTVRNRRYLTVPMLKKSLAELAEHPGKLHCPIPYLFLEPLILSMPAVNKGSPAALISSRKDFHPQPCCQNFSSAGFWWETAQLCIQMRHTLCQGSHTLWGTLLTQITTLL